MHIRFSCDILEVIWTSYACSVYTACKESICVTLRKLWFSCSKSESHKFSALFEIGICQLIQRFFRNSYFPKYLLVLLQQIKIFRIAFFSITNTTLFLSPMDLVKNLLFWTLLTFCTLRKDLITLVTMEATCLALIH